MDGLLSFLLFAGLLYLMMRLGCGAHMIHGGHRNHKKPAHSSPSDTHGNVTIPTSGR